MKIEKPAFPGPVWLIDDFLAPEDASACLQECIDLKPVYMPASVGFGAQNRRDPRIRQNDVVMMDSVFAAERSRSKILTKLDERVRSRECNMAWHEGYTLFDAINYANWRETVLSRYGMCDFYGRHQDTIFSQEDAAAQVRRRIVTMVVYLNTEPEQFTGGDLTLYEADAELTVTPKHNRAVVFPSFMWHNVKSVVLEPDKPWSGGRFSVNHWLGFR